MKKTLSLIIVLGFLPLNSAFAIDTLAPSNPISVETIQAVGPVDNNPTLLPSLQSTLTDTSGNSNFTSGSAGLASCNSDSGGSLGSVGSGLLKQLLSGSSLSSLLGSVQGGNISGIINTLTGGSKTGQLVSSLLTGNGNIGSILNSAGLGNILNGSSLGNIAGNLLGNSGVGSSIGNIAGNLLGNSGVGSAVSGLLGGGLGSLAGGPLGLVSGLLGGGEIPVNDGTLRSYTQKLQANAQKIQTDQDTQLQVVCVQNVLVSKVSQQFTAENTKNVLNQLNTGNGGEPGYSQNPTDDAVSIANTVFTNVMNEIPNSGANNPTQVQQYLNAVYNVDGKQSLKCPLAKVDLVNFTSFEDFANLMAYNPQCTDRGANAIASDILDTRTANRQEVQAQITKTSDIYPVIACDDVNGNGKSLANCERFKIKTPASISNSAVQRAVNAGYDQEARAAQIGQLVDPLFAQIGQQVLTSLQGLLGLSKKSSTGNGSYLDVVAGASQSATATSGKTSLNKTLDGTLSLEYTYQRTLADMLSNLGTTKDAYANVQSCYQALVTKGGGTGIDLAGATLKMNQASSTILTVLTPQIQTESLALDDSQSTITTLEALKAQAVKATVSTELNALSDAYQGLSDYATLHNQNDLTALTNDRDASKILLQSMITDANAELTTCKNY